MATELKHVVRKAIHNAKEDFKKRRGRAQKEDMKFI